MLDPRRFNEFKQYFAEISILVRGELDAEYKKTAALIKEWDARRDYDALKTRFDQDVASHEAERRQFMADRLKYQEQMAKANELLVKKDKELLAREAEIKDAHNALLGAQSNHESDAKAAQAAIQARAKELDKREADLESLQKSLHAREQELSAKNAKVSRAMTTLNELRS